MLKCINPKTTSDSMHIVAPVNRIRNGVGRLIEKGNLRRLMNDGMSKGKEKNAINAQR